MFCSQCGASIPETATNCPQCGASTANAATPSAPPGIPAAPAPVWQPAAQVQTYTGPQQTDGKAVASLILGIASVALCLSFIAGIPAVILGHMSKSNIARSMGRLKGDGMATAGLIMGYISFTVMIPVILIMAAIAIPNLLRARINANEAAAASTVRVLTAAQMTYNTTYSGYAPSLPVLGPGESAMNCADQTKIDAQHACLIEGVLACPETWCTKGAYRFNMTAVCDVGVCKDFVVTALPVTPGRTGQKSFCSTSDGIVRFGGASRTTGAILTPPTVEECQSWPMIR